MRRLLLAPLLLCAISAGACASSNAVPRPFPTPGPAWPAPPAPPGQAETEPAPDGRPAETGYGLAGTALSYRGVPYRNGGTDPADGFDCSGFVWYVFAQHGISVPRTVAEQFRAGTPVDVPALRAGDLVFFNTTGVSPSHVGIAIGGDQFVHAPSSTGEVRVERISTSYWAGRFVGVKRVD
jgi:cell wall-associated NlpC family hydrolase